MSKALYQFPQQTRNNRKLVTVGRVKKDLATDGKTQYENEYKTTGLVVLVAIAYWAIATANQWISGSEALILVWLPSGLSLLAALWLKEPGVLGVGLGAWCLNIASGYPLPKSVLLTLAVLLQVMVGKWLLSRNSDVFTFKHLRDILRPICLAAFVPTLISATLVMLAQAPGFAVETLLTDWLRESLGILAVVPFALAIARKKRLLWLRVQQRWLEAGVSFLSLIGLSWIIFRSPAESVIHAFHAENLVLIFAFWISLRLGLVGAMFSAGCVIVFSILGLQAHHGPFIAALPLRFSPSTLSWAIISNQLFLSAMICSSFLIATSETHLRAVKDHLRKLGRYVAPKLIDELAGLHLAADSTHRQSIALLDVEIKDFANTVEHLTPEGTLELIREFHNRMGTSVAEYQGVIQSRTSDRLVAIFGVSQINCQSPSVSALACARAMIESLGVYNATQVLAGQIPILVSIGADYGTAILDSFTRSSKQDFMIAGKVAKTVMCLRDLCIPYQSDICMSQAMKDSVSRQSQDKKLLDGFQLEGSQRLLGFSEPVTIWSLRSQVMKFYYGGIPEDSDFLFEDFEDQEDHELVQSILNEAEQMHELMQKGNGHIPHGSQHKS